MGGDYSSVNRWEGTILQLIDGKLRLVTRWEGTILQDKLVGSFGEFIGGECCRRGEVI